jgi:uncharacterized metal-binding protein
LAGQAQRGKLLLPNCLAWLPASGKFTRQFEKSSLPYPQANMPSGKTHDLITYLAAVPTAYCAYTWTRGNWQLAALVVGAMLFSGLMFGPDLDIHSKQYTRWGALRVFWWPYQKILPHRSRLSHGIIFGPAVRIIYFCLVTLLAVMAYSYVRASWLGGEPLTPDKLARQVPRLESYASWAWQQKETWAVLIGLWWGAATHTLTDVGLSILRKVWEIF